MPRHNYSREIMHIIRINPFLKGREVAEMVNVSISTVYHHLRDNNTTLGKEREEYVERLHAEIANLRSKMLPEGR